MIIHRSCTQVLARKVLEGIDTKRYVPDQVGGEGCVKKRTHTVAFFGRGPSKAVKEILRAADGAQGCELTLRNDLGQTCHRPFELGLTQIDIAGFCQPPAVPQRQHRVRRVQRQHHAPKVEKALVWSSLEAKTSDDMLCRCYNKH